MSELAIVDPFFGEVLSPVIVDTQEDIVLREEVDRLLSAIHNHELKLATSYVRLGNTLLKVRTKRCWEGWGFVSWGSYIDSLRERIDRARSQLYSYIAVSEILLPQVPEDVLESIGISRALELKRFATLSGKRITPELLATATDPKKGIAELRAAVFEAMHQKPDDVSKRYFDLCGFFCSSDERKEINRGFEVAAQVDPPISAETPEPARRLEVMLRLCREFVSTWEPTLSQQ